MTAIGTVIDGKYEILKEIGRGGMSIVYLAMDKHLNKQWAVKEIRKKGNGKNDEVVVNSLLAEANLMKRLDHPSLPRIVDIIDNGITIYIVMDYIEGESLDKILLEYGAQPEELVIGWAKQLCDALSYLHSQKPPIIYRDMKPANVMLKPEGNIKIIDFGIAREYKEQNLADTTVLGTKGYAPPEQYSGQTDARSDIFALGMTMHHLLTGVDPRNGEPYAPIRQWNPELSEGLEIIIDRCVEPASENRYQNCADLLYDLEHPELITKGYKKKQRQKLISFGAALGLSVLGLISGFGCDMAATNINNNDYEVLVSANTGSVEDKISSYKDAIAIYPNEPKAYLMMLNAYEEDGVFTDAQNREFLAVYDANKINFDQTDPEVTELKYKLATMYFNSFKVLETGETEAQKNIRMSMLNAGKVFDDLLADETALEGFDKAKTAGYFHAVCDYYREYLLGGDTGSVEEATSEGYNQMLEDIRSLMEEVAASEENDYTKLSMYDTIFVLLYALKDDLPEYEVPQENVEAIYEMIYREAESAPVKKSASKSYKDNILNNYNKYLTDIQRVYNNAKAGEGE